MSLRGSELLCKAVSLPRQKVEWLQLALPPPLKIISAPGNHGKEVLRALVGRLPGVRPPGSALCPTDHLKILLPPLSTV